MQPTEIPYTLTATYTAYSGVTTRVLFHLHKRVYGPYELDRATRWYSRVNRILQKWDRRNLHKVTYTLQSAEIITR